MAECFKMVVLHIEILYTHMQISYLHAGVCVSAYQDMSWNMSTGLLHHMTEADFYVRSGNRGTTVMLGHMIALTLVTRSLGYFPSSKFGTLLKTALL